MFLRKQHFCSDTGAAALVRGANPSATPTDVTNELVNNATPNKVSDAQTDPNLLLYVN